MAVDQTTVQDQKSVISGSVMLRYSVDSGSTFVNVGVGDGFTFTENITKLDQTPDNGPTPEKLEGISAQTVNIAGNLWEYNLEKFAAMRGGIDLFTSTAAGTVTGATKTVASGDWAYDRFILLEGQNADNTAQTITSITLGTDGAIVDGTDYFQTQDSNGDWGIMIIDSATVTTLDQTVVPLYDYSPGAVDKFTTGGLSTQANVWVQLINKTPDTADASDAAAAGISEDDAINRVITYDFYYTTLDAGNTATFPAETATETVIKFPVGFLAKSDPTRTAGDKLYAMTKSIELA